jgi:hypothetical protein
MTTDTSMDQLSLPITTAISSVSQTPSNYFYVFYQSAHFGLPLSYFRNAPQPEISLGGDDSSLSHDLACDAFYKRCSNEWNQMGGGAGILFW